MPQGKRQKDEALAKYFAYRIALYLREHKMQPVKLAKLIGIDKAVLSDLSKGRNGSYMRVKAVARVLKPESEEEFKQLAHVWAEENPAWKAGDPLPERITRTGHPLEASPKGGPSVYSEGLRDAAVAIVGLAKCSPDVARQAAELARKAIPEEMDGDWLFWLQHLKDYVEHLKKGSGERPSSRQKLP